MYPLEKIGKRNIRKPCRENEKRQDPIRIANMQTKIIVYPLILTLMLVIPVTRYYVSTPGINACVIDYAETLGNGKNTGYLYSIK